VSDDCLFCAIVAGDRPAHVVLETEHVVAILDHRPVFKGHTLVLPREHVATLPDLPERLLVPVFSVVQQVARAMVDGLGADGTWVPVNNTVSQAVPHLHVHVVPRRFRDGLRGFFWPREGYDDDADAAAHAERLRAALTRVRR